MALISVTHFVGWWRHSLKVRMSVYFMLGLAAATLALSWYASQTVKEDMQQQLTEQQRSTVQVVAGSLEGLFADRFDVLNRLAGEAAPRMSGGPSLLVPWLNDQALAAGAFNRGVFLTNTSGIAVASWPESAGRLGLSYSDRDYIVVVLREGRAAIGRPVIGRPLGKPVLLMAVPVKDASGSTVGAMVGVTDLGRPNVLDSLISGHDASGVQYFLIDGAHRLIVTGTQRERAMEPLPPPGESAAWDKLLAAQFLTVPISDQGVEALASSTRIASVGWHLVVTSPYEKTLAPIDDAMRDVVYAVGLVMILGMLGVMWILQRELKPLQAATAALANAQKSGTLAWELPRTRPDEIGALIDAFNGLLRSLRESDSRLRVVDLAMRSISQGVVIADVDQRIVSVNPGFEQITGYSPDEVEGRTCRFLQGVATQSEAIAGIREALAAQRSFSGEILNYRKDGAAFWNELTISPVKDSNGKLTHFVGVVRDITERRTAHDQQRISATAFDSQEGIYVTSADTRIVRVNQAFVRITGYDELEAVGRFPQELLNSGRQTEAFYQGMWESLQRDGSWHGELWNRRKSGEVFPESITITAVKDEHGATTHYVANFIDISERKQTEAAIYQMAFHDGLTQLPNRQLLQDRLSQSILSSHRRQAKGALLFVDLDNFKLLNDTRGHQHGDQLLQQVAGRMLEAVRECDTVARLGGDEFVVLLEDLDADPLLANRAAGQVGQKLLASFERPFEIEGSPFHCTASIGVTLFGGELESSNEPLKRADLAMYQAKTAGRNTLRFFDQKIQQAMSTRAHLEELLRSALGHGEMHLHFQPLVDPDFRVVGAEALLRWSSPTEGLVPPDQFIPLAEDSGLILPIGQWVLEQACKALAAWTDDPALSALQLSINVSIRQFQQPDFAQHVRKALAAEGVNPSRLKLEITENVLADRIDELILTIKELSALGVRISLDDFGTGYSSLSYLKRLPIDELKIDRSFVRDILVDSEDAAIAEMVLAMAKTLALNVVAEGVETEEQRQFLLDKGCTTFQGYLFSRPLPADAFADWVRSSLVEQSGAA